MDPFDDLVPNWLIVLMVVCFATAALDRCCR